MMMRTKVSRSVLYSSATDSSSSTTTSVKSSLEPNRNPRPQYIPGSISDPNYVRIFDTTLRDGEQSPGATLTSSEKLDIARNLAKLGVDIIEAGFPVASPDDFAAVEQIAKKVGNEIFDDGYVPVICGLSRANERDIKIAWDAVKHAKFPRVHTFIATSKIHMETKLRKTPEEVLDIAVKAVTYAKSLGCTDIEFSPEDAGRSDPKFLYKILEATIEAGATTLNIPDTTGWNMPWEFGEIIRDLRENVKGAENVIFSTHCQNDLGLSTANSLAGVLNGARQVECTINGIGERAGNASLEEVVMALALKGKTHFGQAYRVNQNSPDIDTSPNTPFSSALPYTAVNPVYITPTSKMVTEYTGMICQPHKAIVGANAFQHESGIHQDGMIKNKSTYEIMSPESIGLLRGDSQSGAGIVLGKHSGRNAVSTRLRELGYGDLEKPRLDAIFARFKEVAEKRKGGMEDDDLEALVVDNQASPNNLWIVGAVQVIAGSAGVPTATVAMVGPDGVSHTIASTGTGPVDAVYKCINQITGVDVELVSYGLNSVTEGIDALAVTRVVVTPTNEDAIGGKRSIIAAGAGEINPNNDEDSNENGQDETYVVRKFSGSGSDADIVVSSARAYVSAINRLLSFNMRKMRINASKE